MHTENNFGNTLSLLNRKEKFEIWKLRANCTCNNLAAILGMSQGAFSKMMANESIPTAHHRSLLAAGVPVDCLPPPEDKKRGPKPRLTYTPIPSPQTEAATL
jgi:hypothetical protein